MPTKKKRAAARGKAKKGKAKNIARVTRAAKKKGVVSKTKRAIKPRARPARVKRKDLPRAARQAVTHASTCGEPCRVCGGECSRAGLHEQHRCRDHVGMSA